MSSVTAGIFSLSIPAETRWSILKVLQGLLGHWFLTEWQAKKKKKNLCKGILVVVEEKTFHVTS